MTRSLRPSGFFVLHTPLLSFDELAEWSSHLEAPAADLEAAELDAAVAADRASLRGRLRALFERAEMREALFLSSPALFAKAGIWLDDPDSEEGRSVEQSLVRYVLRMASTCPPTGAMSGGSLGSIGTRTVLRLRERGASRRQPRLDLYYLDALAEALGRDADLRPRLRYRRNPSLYRAADHWRYAEPQREPGPRIFRTFRLTSLEASEALDCILDCAASWVAFPDLVQTLMATDPAGDLSAGEVEEFLRELIENHILVSDLSPALTGGDPLATLVDRLQEIGSRCAEPLAQVLHDLEEIGDRSLGVEPRRYVEMAERLASLPVVPELPRLIQVDLLKAAAEASLDSAVLAEIERAIFILRCCSDRSPSAALASFRQAFVERFGEGRAVPLSEALDEDSGAGFRALPERREMPAACRAVLEARLDRALADGALEIELGERDFADLDEISRLPLPGALYCVASVAASRIHLLGAFGSPGLGTPARLCHWSRDLRDAFAKHLQAEEGLEPDAIHAEVVHWPDGRPGNAALRPRLRSFEIPVLDRGGAPEEHQIPVEDLRVTVVGERIVLTSERLGRRILPCQAVEAGPGSGLPAYELLSALQGQDAAARLQWNWGSWSAGLPFLPRVVTGRVVLSRATWRITGEEIRAFWHESDEAARFRAIQRWRLPRKLPRWVVMVDGSKQLLVDFHNVLAIEAFLSMVWKYQVVQVEELFPQPDELCAVGPEGRFLHEMVIPLLAAGPAAPGRS